MSAKQKKTAEGRPGYSFSPSGTGGRSAPNAPAQNPGEDRASHGELDSTDEAERREERVVCSFPGLMKVLVPEKSFVPIPMAVRVANMSSGGALVEIHDRAREDQALTMPDRFFELKVAHPEIPELRGTIAWMDFSREKPLLGLSFFERHEALATHFLVSETHQGIAGPPPLPELQIDPFPPVTHEETVVITGAAPEALEVVIRCDEKSYTKRVENGRFAVPIELREEKRNTFTVQAMAGVRRSRQIPIQIAFERKTNQNKFTYSVSQNQAQDGSWRVRVSFNGNMRQVERMLYRFSQIHAHGDRMVIDATVTATEPFDKRLLEAMQSEGAVLAADTTRNEVAAKLLDELLF